MARIRRRVSVAAPVVVLLLSAAGCWPQPGQNADRNAFNPFEGRLTVATVGSLTEAWSAPLDGPTFVPRNNPSGEIVTGHGGVFVNDGGALYRFDAADGGRDWRKPLQAFPPEVQAEMGQALVVEDRLLVGFGTVGDSTGAGSEWHSLWVDPKTGDTLEAGPDGGLPTAVRGSKVALIGATCIEFTFCGGTYQVVDLDDPGATSTGSLGPFLGPAPPATLGGTRLYVPGIDLSVMSSKMSAYPLTGGQTTALWNTVIEQQTPTGEAVLSPDESTLYTGTRGTGHTLYALDAATGAIVWKADVGAGVAAPAALAKGLLYVPTADGDLVVLDAAGCGAPTCSPLWSAPTGSPLTTQPAVAGGVVYTGSQDGTVAAFAADGCGAATCPALWSDDAGAAITGAPVVSGGQLFVVSADAAAGQVVAYAA